MRFLSDSQRSLVVRSICEESVDGFFPRFHTVAAASDCNKVNLALLVGMNEHFLVEVNILAVNNLLLDAFEKGIQPTVRIRV